MPDSPERIRLLQHLAMRMAEGNVNDALAWADSLGTEHERAAAYGHIALVISDSDPKRAANLLSESGMVGRDFDVVTVQVLGRWAAQSPADAAAWVVMFPAGESRQAGIRSVVSTWVEADAAAAISWLDTIRDPSVRKETIAGMAAALGRQSAEQRDEWLGHASSQLRAEITAAREVTNPGWEDNPQMDGIHTDH